MEDQADSKFINSISLPIVSLFTGRLDVDFYQREYVWQDKHMEDLINDLSSEFLKNWVNGSDSSYVKKMDPYFMGEIVLSETEQGMFIIDGQQRITSFTLLFIYIYNHFSNLPNKFRSDLLDLIYIDDFGQMKFILDIPERENCMISLLKNGCYTPLDSDSPSVKNIVERYEQIDVCWNDRITEELVEPFTYWLKNKVYFSKVWTNNNELAYVIFETMNDRGLSLTQIEMLRSFLLSKINDSQRPIAMTKFDDSVKTLTSINKIGSKSKAEFDFFKMYFRSHLANDFSQTKDSNSDFVRIGKEFHRWVRDNEIELDLKTSDGRVDFINHIQYFSSVFKKIYDILSTRDTVNYLYIIVNNDFSFTLQPALLLASVAYNDSDEVIYEKFKVVSKYLTRYLSSRVWNHMVISQSTLESPIYSLCKTIRGKTVDEIKKILASDPLDTPTMEQSPSLNQINTNRIRVLLSLITEIVAQGSNAPDYMLNKNESIEVEHVICDHYEWFTGVFESQKEFFDYRNNIGDLLVLPKSFNASYGDALYEVKVQKYIEQNILAQSLNESKYDKNPGFMSYKNESGLPFTSYNSFGKEEIMARADLYKLILMHHWGDWPKKANSSDEDESP